MSTSRDTMRQAPPRWHLAISILVLSSVLWSTVAGWPIIPRQSTPQQVNISFDDENISFWDPFKRTGFNASAHIVPALQEAKRAAPLYLGYAGIVTGMNMFLPPRAVLAAHIAYVALVFARSHEDVETFCRNEGKLLLASPSLHLAIVGGALRLTRFRLWRKLFVKASLFRLRYQLMLRRMYRPRWIRESSNALEAIVRDTSLSARSVQGLMPSLCHQAALVAEGFRIPYWSECHPPPKMEKGLNPYRSLDRALKREFGNRVRRARRGDNRKYGAGTLGWRIPHKIVLGTALAGSGLMRAPFRGRTSDHKLTDKRCSDDAPKLLLDGGAHDGGDELTVEVLDEGDDGSNHGTANLWRVVLPPDVPLVRFHNVSAVASVGSTLTRCHQALAELPYGDGQDGPVRPEVQTQTSDGAGGPRPPLQNLILQPVIIKRNIQRQLSLAGDDVDAARRVFRRMVFGAKIDLDLSGVVKEIASAVARTRDLRIEAESISRIRTNLATAGMLGNTVVVPEVLTCPELGPLARQSVLVTTALRGVDVADTRVMSHAAGFGGRERDRFVEAMFAIFGQLCLVDGLFPSNPTPENLLYMYGGQVGLTDMSAVAELDGEQRRSLCRLYRTMWELRNEDASHPSPTAESKAKAAMQGIGIVVDLPPEGGISWSVPSYSAASSASAARGGWAGSEPKPSSEDVRSNEGMDSNRQASNDVVRDDTISDEESSDIDDEEGELNRKASDSDAEVEEIIAQLTADEDHVPDGAKEEERQMMADTVADDLERGLDAYFDSNEGEEVRGDLSESDAPLRTVRPPLTYLMLLRGLFDTREDASLDLIGGGGMVLLRAMAVRRLPRAMVPALRMVANLRGICARLDIDKSLLPSFSKAASRGLSWRLAMSRARRGGAIGDACVAGVPLSSNSGA